MMDDWLKGVLAGAGAVLVASAWTMKQTAKTVREAEDSPFDDLPRENALVGGVDFQADDVSIDPLTESPTSEDPATAGASDMGGPDDSLGAVPVETEAQKAGMIASHEIEPALGRGATFNLGAETEKEKRRAKWARRMRGSLKHGAEGYSDTDPIDYNAKSVGGPAELFDESVVQDKQDSGVDFMNAEGRHKYKELTLENLPKDSLLNMIESSSDIITYYGDKEDLLGEGVYEDNIGTVGGYYQEFIDGANRSRQKYPSAYKDQDVSTMNAENTDLADSEPTYTPNTEKPIPDGIEPADPSDTFSFRAEARRWRLPKTSKGTALYAKRDKEGKFTDIQNVTRASRIDRAIDAKTHGVASGDGDEGERASLRAEGARRWRLPKTSKGTALYAKRDDKGRFTDIQNVARASRTDRAIKAKTHGVASGHGDEGERAKASPDFLDQLESPFRRIKDMVDSIWDAEDNNLISCSSCESFWAECGCKGSEYYEASGSNYMKPKDAAAVFAKNKNKLCSVTFTKKNGSTRILTGRTGVFRARDGSTIVGKGRKPTWDSKARAKAGFITMWDADAARKAGDNRSGFRVVNLHTISSIRAMGNTYDAAHPKGY